MSTLSGPTSKGEKGKSKFQSLDINNLYKHSRGESSEPHQQKNIIPRKHGMQSLGKVPSTRRPPVNLPSLKSEHSGNDPAVSLVPSGGTGWGSKPGETGPTPTSQPSSQTPTLTPTPVTQTPAPSAGAPAAAPTSTAPPPVTQTSAPQTTQSVLVGSQKGNIGGPVVSSGGDKTWSSVTCGTEAAPSFLAHQSPQFQQEFPSLSGEGVGPGPPPPKTDTQYGPGPSLRPQTEGSWIQGGGARGVQGSGGLTPQGNQQASTPSQDGGARNNLAQFGAAGAPGGQPTSQGSSNFKGVFPPFMVSRGGGYPSIFSGNFRQNSRYQYQPENRQVEFSKNRSRTQMAADPEDLIPRPIIREEDLNRMDELASDASWAVQDEIDYNQTLNFGDEESTEDDKDSSDKKHKEKSKTSQEAKEEKKEVENEKETREKQIDRVTSSPGDRNQPWQGRNNTTVPTQGRNNITVPTQGRNNTTVPTQGRNNTTVPTIPPTDFRGPPPRSSLQGNRGVDDDELWRERRRQHSEQLAAVTEKAKQRKEEEEKRFEESRAKMDSDKKKTKDEGGVNEPPPPNPLVPEWEKEDKTPPAPAPSNKEASENFRQMTQLDSRSNFGRERERERDREMRSERDGQYQRFNNLPPRLQKQLIDRPSGQQYPRQPSSSAPGQGYESRWAPLPGNQNPQHFPGKNTSNDRGGSRRNRSESEVSDKEIGREREEELKERDRRDRHTPELNSDRDRFRRGDRGHDNRKSGYEPAPEYNRSYQREREYERERDRIKDFDYKKRNNNDDAEREEPEWEGRRGADWENNRHYEDRNRRGDIKKSETFEERDNDWRGGDRPDSRDSRPERPQRPDSRDSRASRDSRNSRDSNREEPRLIQEVTDNEYPWVEAEFPKEAKEEKPFRKEVFKEERNVNQHRQREGHVHVPGPITREKMEAYEYKHNLAQGDKKESSVVLGGVGGTDEETSWGNKQGSGTGGQGSNVSWADSTDEGGGAPPQEQQTKSQEPVPQPEPSKEENLDKVSEKEDVMDKKKDIGKKDRGEKASRSNRSVRGGRQGGYSSGSYAVYSRQSWGGGRTDPKRGPTRVSSQKQWNQSESEISGDEVSASTESGKEDKKDRKQAPRSPKSGGRKGDKEGRNKESQCGDLEKPATPKQERKQGGGERKEREGFAPRGEPSRRGRGGGFRTRGAISSTAGHYGPPGNKSPFPQQQSAQQDEDAEKSQEELSLEEKMKLKQQALAAGISGAGRQQKNDSQQARKLDGEINQRMGKNKGKTTEQGEEAWETTSETSDNEGKGRKGFPKNKPDRKPMNRPPIGDKRGGYNMSQMNGRPGRPEELKLGDDNMGEKKRDKIEMTEPTGFANNGFQEVKNKKPGKEGSGSGGRPTKDDSKRGRGGKGKEKGGAGGQGTGRGQGQSKPYPREWCNNKPPRLQRMENLRKQQLHHNHEVSDMNKINQSVSLFMSRDNGCPPPAPPPTVNAWEKPITATLRTTPPPSSNPLQLGATISPPQDKTGIEMNDHGQSGTSSQTSSPSAEKALTKMAVEKSLLDGTTPPVQTIIFENTNYKATPGEMSLKPRYNMGQKGQRMDKGRERKIEEELEESHGMGLGFKTGELKPGDKAQESIQMSMAFNKNEDNADMKLDFAFDSDLSQLTDDKSNIPRSIHLGQTSAADLDQKIASVKKVWDTPAGSVMEHQHHVDEGHVVSTASSFTPPFGSAVDASLDPTAPHQVDDSAFTSGDVYSSGPQIQGSNSYATSGPSMIKQDPNSATGSVCKVKPQPQPTAVVLPSGMGPHSPPPYTQPGHINYQAAPFTGMPGIPSPPTALFGSAQQVPNQGDLYHSYPLGNTPQVLGGQGRSTFSQFQYGLSQGLSQTSAYSQYHLQTAPPPNAPPPDVFSSISLYRTQGSNFGGSQQLSNSPNTVLISSTSNSLMSASVKSTTQPIGAIGSKTPYQSTAPPSQVYVQYDTSQMYPQNFMASSQLVQQRPGVQAVQASPSFYSNPGAQTGLFQGSSMLGTASAQAPLHSATFGIQSFGTQSPAPAPTATPNQVAVPSYASQINHMRGQGPGAAYLKPTGGPNQQHPGDSAKSPSTNQEVLQSVFSGQQIPSPKSRGSGGGGGKQGGSAPQQPSPTQSHHKFSSYQHSVSQPNLVMQQQQGQGGGGQRTQQLISGSGVRGVNSTPRYPQPIQRPTYQQQGMMRHSGGGGGRPLQPSRTLPNNKLTNQYFQQQGNSVKLEGSNLEAKSETGSECKIGESGSGGGGGKQLSQAQCDKVKEEAGGNPEQ